MAKVIRGTIHCITGCAAHSCSDQWYLEPPNEPMFPVVPHEDQVPEQFIEATLDGDRIVDFTVLVEAEATQTVNMALVRVGRSEAEFTPAVMRELERRARELKYELRRLTSNRWDIEVEPYTYVSQATIDVTRFPWATLERDLPGHTHYHIWGGNRTDIAGHAFVGGRHAVTFLIGNFATKVHESLHNLKLRHAATPEHEYGGRPSWMASGVPRNRLEAPQMAEMGLIDSQGQKVLRQGDNGCFFLIDGESSPLARRPGELKLLRIEARLPSWPAPPVAVALTGGTVRVYTGQARSFTRTEMIADLRPGETFQDGISVKFDALHEGCARVLVSWNGQLPGAEPFPEAPETDMAGDLGGLWFRRDMTHQGFQVLQIGQRRIVYWYTADRHGNLIWLYGDDDKLYAWHNGRFGLVGHCRLYRLAEGRARWEAWSPMTGRVAVSLYQLAKNDRRERLLALEGRNNEGLVIGSYGGQEIGYLYERDKWRMLQAGQAFLPDDVRFMIRSDSGLIDQGPYELSGYTVKLNGEQHYLREIGVAE